MKKYLRFGEIPTNEKSIKWKELTFDQNEDLTYDISLGGDPLTAVTGFIKHCRSWKNVEINKVFEAGVSVFELDENNKPVLNNDKLVSSYNIRRDQKAYIVTGDEVAIGDDGEPLIINVKIVEEI